MSTPAIMEQAREVLYNRFGFPGFRPGQEEIVAAVLSERDVLAVMPTGGGKSLCYQLPALLLDGLTVVVSPLIALMKDQVDSLVERDIAATFINSSIPYEETRRRLAGVESGEYRLVYVAPERFRNRMFTEAIGRRRVVLLAVDEAHCISQWGHDFRPDYKRLDEVRRRLGGPRVIALTATATAPVREDILASLGMEGAGVFVRGFDRENLFLDVRKVRGREEKNRLLRQLLAEPGGPGIVYCATKRNVDEVAGALAAAAKHEVLRYHGGMDATDRTRVQERFMTANHAVVVATNAFGMGVDRADIRFVAHHDLPGSLEAYYQEVGRAGRDGKPARCVLLFNHSDVRIQEFFIEGSCPQRDVIRRIYAGLLDRPGSRIEIPQADLARRAGVSNPMAAGTALKVLEEAGYVFRHDRFESSALARLRVSAARALAEVGDRAALRRVVLENLIACYGPDLDAGVRFPLDAFGEQIRVPGESLRRAFRALAEAGLLTFVAPFRGRAVEVLVRVDPDRIEVDLEAIELRRKVETEKLRTLLDFVYSERCRRASVLQYFDDRRPHADGCSACDVCAGGPGRNLSDDERTVIRGVIDCVKNMRGRFGKRAVAGVLTGARTKQILDAGLDAMRQHGLLKGMKVDCVVKIIEALVDAGWLRVHGSQYPTVALSAKGNEAVRRGEAPEVLDVPPFGVPSAGAPVRPAPRERRRGGNGRETPPVAAGPDGLDGAEEQIYEQLRRLRFALASARRVPPYMVFSNRSLADIARRRPQSAEDLLECHGCGKVTIDRYGEQVLGVVRKSLREAMDRQP